MHEAVTALALWAGLNILWMLALALNVSRFRFQELKGEEDPAALHRAVRAHGNNIEYVPAALIALAILVALNFTATWIHALGASLLVARILHGIGMQQVSDSLPPARVVGNFMTWAVFVVSSLALITAAL